MSLLKYNIPFNLDSTERTLFHKSIILRKKFLKNLYIEWYKIFLKSISNLPKGKIIEIGSGGGFIKEIIPSVITSDFLNLPENDMCFSATDMPFNESELSAIFMIDTFHHIPDVEKFLFEAERTLKKGGKIIMIEPANTLWGRFIYKNFHHEAFLPESSWKLEGDGPMSDANGALPWIVFERDIDIFKNKFKSLQLIDIKYHTPLRYLLSGGVSFKQLVPDFMFLPITYFENFILFFTKQFSMFVTIEIEKI
ncbi:MAG: class I SAM-dependent methyltransferase [Bacteroidales bacterium]|nr:class I SAM-dependent methyltransferase [Bacteroidales bacterium]MBN2756798.1 class I SAM-dependent methyltransferase [Bacteroidales bacterium]